MDDHNFQFKELSSRVDFGVLTDRILEFWKKNDIFKKSVEQRDIKNPYVFYDGPPFVTGLPHYGHLLGGIAKDLIPRYWTMKGKRVERVWGWDCHGLPIENKVEKKLNLNSRKEIEKVGIEKFVRECSAYVSQVSLEWDWYVEHSGRWVDMKNAYHTMDQDYMESVWWVFKQIYDKNYIYKGKRVSLYCPRCGTPISNFEVAMDNSYKQITEPSNVYKYQLDAKKNDLHKVLNVPDKTAVDFDKTYILAWSTTPWNKLATPALAVNPKLDYVLVKQGEEFFVLAKTTLSILGKDVPYQIISQFKGSDLDGLSFVPHYDFYKIPKGKKAWVIVGDEFVTAEDGTGVVTLAIYGEDDFRVMQANNIALLEHVDEEGMITLKQAPFAGVYYLKANKLVNQDLSERGLMYQETSLTHSVATCWRCNTRLMFKPQDAWFIAVEKLKDQLLKTNEDIYWFPNHLKHGRFKKGIESAPDWCISRSRYWATPMPVWQCDHCHKYQVVASRAEVEKLSGKKVKDMHRPFIDQHQWQCPYCEKGTMKRIEDVLDSWMDAGSMPYAQVHYPFDNKQKFEASFPADYIVEYVAQTRAWFYVLHVLSNALFEKPSFKNVICTGVIQGTDGRKMSKSYGNYPDPKRVLESYGGDAFRLYLMSSPIMAAENLNINEKEIEEQNKRVLSILWNSFKYFITYANLNKFKPQQLSVNDLNLDHILDRWLLQRLSQFKVLTSKYIEEYNIPKATRLIRGMVGDLSTWYIRLSRDRFVAGDRVALQNLYYVLVELSKTLAPTLPFISEEIYQYLVVDLDKNAPLSVHLCDWPQPEFAVEDKDLLETMEQVRNICSLGNAFRKQQQIPSRQPLSKVEIVSETKLLQDEMAFYELIKTELNVKTVSWTIEKGDLRVSLDTKLTKELEDEGESRRLIRKIQAARKKAGIALDKQVKISLPDWPKAYEKEIKRRTLVSEIVKGKKLEILTD